MACVRCDIMDTTDQDIYSADVVWGDESLALSYIYDSYAYCVMNFCSAIGESYSNPATTTIRPGANWDTTTDNLISPTANESINNDTYTVSSDAGWDVFEYIRRANIIIQESTNSNSFSELTQKSYIAHGRFLRGLIYLRHARMFGGAILIDKPLTTDDEFLLPRNTIEDTYNFIIEDFLAAGADISTTTNVMGDASTAYGLAVEAALQAASYVDNGNKKDYYFEIALEASELCLSTATTSLDPSYYDMFNTFGSPESLPEVSFLRCITSSKYYSQSTSSYVISPYFSNSTAAYTSEPLPAYPTALMAGQTTMSVSQDMYDCYQVVDEDGVAKKWNETSYYDDYMANGGYVSQVTMKNRDERFYASILLDSTEFGDIKHMVYTRKNGNAHRSLSTISQGQKNGLYPICKSTHDQYWQKWGAAADYHQVIFRLGRAYLNHAEVLLRLGRTSEALDYVNKIRTTHGGLPEVSTSLSADDAWTAYCYERRVELFYECDDRYWSLLRWAKMGDSYSADAIAALDINNATMNETQPDGMSWEVIDMPVAICDYPDHVWSEKRFALPIPQAQIDASGGLIKQNPYWDLGVTEFY